MKQAFNAFAHRVEEPVKLRWILPFLVDAFLGLNAVAGHGTYFCLPRIPNKAFVTQDIDVCHPLRDRFSGETLIGTGASYAYDVSGRRVAATRTSQVAPQTTQFIWDEFSAYGDIVAELDGSGQLQASYVLGGMGVISQNSGEDARYYTQDALGSARALTDSASALTDGYRYDAYGSLYSEDAPLGEADPAASFLYTGHRYDSDTGLYQMRARYYDAGVGRFLSRDTYPVNAGNPRELNRYGYVAGNPVNGVDPSGLNAFSETLTIGAAVTVSIASIAAIWCVTGFLCPGLRDFYNDYLPRLLDGDNLSRGLLASLIPFAFTIVSGVNHISRIREDEEAERRQKHVALGLQSNIAYRDSELLVSFAWNLNAMLNPFGIDVYMYRALFGTSPVNGKNLVLRDWQAAGLTQSPVLTGNFDNVVPEVLNNARFIHFNLEAIIGGYKEFADLSTGSFSDDFNRRVPITATELNIVRKSYCHKVSFYETGSVFPPVPSIKAYTEICGLRRAPFDA